MKIPASTAFAVVAVFLPIVTCAAEEEDDRSCEKRDKEAKEVGDKVVKNCNFWCLPHKDNSDYYVEKHYPDGTKCQYTESLQSLCIKKECHHPQSDIYKNYVSKNSGGNKMPPEKNSGEAPEAPKGEEEPPETPHNVDEGPEQDDEQEKKKEDEDEAGKKGEEEDEDEAGEEEEEEEGEMEKGGEKEKEDNEETRKNEGEEVEEEEEDNEN